MTHQTCDLIEMWPCNTLNAGYILKLVFINFIYRKVVESLTFASRDKMPFDMIFGEIKQVTMAAH